jgi:large subunit ribosomal protein L21
MAEKATTKEKKSDSLAVIKTGGKQYLVREGDTVKVEKILDKSVADTGKVVFEDILMISDGSKVTFGNPTIEKKTVSGELVAEGRNKKIAVIRYKSKSRYFKNKGHRQPFYKIKITKIG